MMFDICATLSFLFFVAFADAGFDFFIFADIYFDYLFWFLFIEFHYASLFDALFHLRHDYLITIIYFFADMLIISSPLLPDASSIFDITFFAMPRMPFRLLLRLLIDAA